MTILLTTELYNKPVKHGWYKYKEKKNDKNRSKLEKEKQLRCIATWMPFDVVLVVLRGLYCKSLQIQRLHNLLRAGEPEYYMVRIVWRLVGTTVWLPSDPLTLNTCRVSAMKGSNYVLDSAK